MLEAKKPFDDMFGLRRQDEATSSHQAGQSWLAMTGGFE